MIKQIRNERAADAKFHTSYRFPQFLNEVVVSVIRAIINNLKECPAGDQPVKSFTREVFDSYVNLVLRTSGLSNEALTALISGFKAKCDQSFQVLNKRAELNKEERAKKVVPPEKLAEREKKAAERKVLREAKTAENARLRDLKYIEHLAKQGYNVEAAKAAAASAASAVVAAAATA